MDHNVTHATFTLERSYPVLPAQVFAAWADPAAKAGWFTPGPGFGHELAFRIDGREVARGGPDGGPAPRRPRRSADRAARPGRRSLDRQGPLRIRRAR